MNRSTEYFWVVSSRYFWISYDGAYSADQFGLGLKEYWYEWAYEDVSLSSADLGDWSAIQGMSQAQPGYLFSYLELESVR